MRWRFFDLPDGADIYSDQQRPTAFAKGKLSDILARAW